MSRRGPDRDDNRRRPSYRRDAHIPRGRERGGRGGHYREDRKRRFDKRAQRELRQPPEPRPVNGKCNPLCPLFVCTKNAYKIKFDRPTQKKYVFCTWIGDECIGASCQYASCKLNYLLPDGSCAWAKQKKADVEVPGEKTGLEDEYDELEKEASKFLGKRFRKTGFDDLY